MKWYCPQCDAEYLSAGRCVFCGEDLEPEEDEGLSAEAAGKEDTFRIVEED
jgi:hypothetical protein